MSTDEQRPEPAPPEDEPTDATPQSEPDSTAPDTPENEPQPDEAPEADAPAEGEDASAEGEDASAEGEEEPAEGEEEQPEAIPLELAIEDTGPCKKLLKITVPRETVDDRLDEALGKLVETASVPGFRPGRAPQKLVRRRFRTELSDQVRSELVAGSIEQALKDNDLTPLTMPNVDFDAIKMPEDSPLYFEVNLEVRPQFDLPEYKGIKLKRLVVDIDDKDVEDAVQGTLRRFGRLVPKTEGGCEAGDYAVIDATFIHGEEEVAKLEEATLVVADEMMTRYARILKLDEALADAKPDDERLCEAELNQQFEREELRGTMVQCRVTLKEVKQVDVPELTDAFAGERLSVDTAEEVRQQIRAGLEARLKQQQRQLLHDQVTSLLVAAADWELPPDLVEKQTENVLSRMQVDLMVQGVQREQIEERGEDLAKAGQQRAQTQLKQFFLLDKIAEAEDVQVEPADLDAHIASIAANYGENPRRIRARMEKEDRIEMLEIQLRETKTLDRILEFAEFEDVTPEQVREQAEKSDEADSAAEAEAAPSEDTQPTETADPSEPKES